MHISCVQGKFQGLDLNEELHVGGYPNYTVLAKTAGMKTGFVGETTEIQDGGCVILLVCVCVFT